VKPFIDEWVPEADRFAVTTRSQAGDRARALYFGGRWADLEALTRQWVGPSVLDYAALEITAYRATALIHLGRHAEALAIDSTLAGYQKPIFQSSYIYARAQIAAQLGDKDRAIALVSLALQKGYQIQFASP